MPITADEIDWKQVVGPDGAIVGGTGEVIAFEARGAVQKLFASRAEEAILAGPAGSGKSRGVLEFVHYLLANFPEAKALVLRKTLVSLTESGLQTYKRDVLHHLDGVRFYGGSKAESARFIYPNGSTLTVGGLDNPTKVMSTEYDIIFVQEATEISLDDHEQLTTRLRNGKIRMANGFPFHLLVEDCNPSTPWHWILTRVREGKLLMLDSRHEDNPRFFNADGTKTPDGVPYMARLDAMTGVRYQRLRLGRWVSAEGTVYESFDPAIHVIPRFKIPADWRRIRAIDFGFVNPLVCYDDRTEVLTAHGWRLFADAIADPSPVATVNQQTHQLEWQTPTSAIQQRYSGPMIESPPGREGVSFGVTPNHRMVIEDSRSGIWRQKRADDLPLSAGIPVGWLPPSDDPDSIFTVSRPANSHFNTKVLAPTTREAFAFFLGLFIAEGGLHTSGRRQSPSYYSRISQKKHTDAVRHAITRLGWHHSEHVNKEGVIQFSIGSKTLYDFLAANGMLERSPNRRVPRFIFDWGNTCLRELLRGLMLGDGSPATVAGERYHTSSVTLADDVQEIAARLGLPSKIRVRHGTSSYTGRPRTMYTVSFPRPRRAIVRSLKTRTIDYDGMVYCFTVPNGTLVVRRDGRPMVCGNCLWFGLSPDQRLYCYREIYRTQRIVADHAKRIKQLSGTQRFVATVADHDAEDRATLHENGIYTIRAKKAIIPGIEAVQELLRVGEDGKPRLYFFNDILVDRETRLFDMGLPTSVLEEFLAYVWASEDDQRRSHASSRTPKELPIDMDNHGLDALRYAAMYIKRRGKLVGPGGKISGKSKWFGAHSMSG